MRKVVSARPCRDNTLFGNGQGIVRPQVCVLWVLSNETKQAVGFVGYPSGKKDSVSLR